MKFEFTGLKNGVYYLTEPLADFESTYIEVRSIEQRVHNDDFVRQLPNVPKGHPHAKEWKKRAHTLQNFSKFLADNKPMQVLDIGCGNGWFTERVANYCENIIAIDVGAQELEQAARCSTQNHVKYACCSDWNKLPEASFDLIYFSGSFQYFTHDEHFWQSLKRLLTPNGEIHVLDTPFYPKHQIDGAKERSARYFSSVGVSKASDYYHHAAWEDLPSHKELLYQPTILNKVFRDRSPFPWVRVKNT